MIVFAGCSYVSGWGLTDPKQSFANIIGERLGKNVLNLAKPGCTNYCITKQIDHAIKLDPEVVVFASTEVMRFDWVKSNSPLKAIPSITDFSYGSYAPEGMSRSGPVVSESLGTLRAYMNNVRSLYIREKYRDLDPTELKIFLESFELTDGFLKKDQDAQMILASMYKLQQSHIKFVFIDGNEFGLAGYGHLQQPWKELVKLDPQTDGLHFGPKANELLAEKLIELGVFDSENH